MGEIVDFPIECTCNSIFIENLCRQCALKAKTLVISRLEKKEEKLDELEDELSELEDNLEQINERLEELDRSSRGSNGITTK